MQYSYNLASSKCWIAITLPEVILVPRVKVYTYAVSKN